MKFSKTRLSVLAALAGIILTGYQSQALPVAAADNKVIIYPTGKETVSQLRQQGVTHIDNYGSYWIAEVTDQQLEAVKATYGSRAYLANYLNRISLRFGSIDTSTGKQFDVPTEMRQPETNGRRLRLVQFKGPIQPEWLADLNRLAGLKIINYVPNNAYLVFMDAATEKQVEALHQMGGPVQWVGPYHPYYKISKVLQDSHGTVDVNLAVVDSAEGEAALKEIISYADRSLPSPRHTLNQITTKIRCNGTILGFLAHMPEVLWIEPIIPIKLADEVQALIVSSHTNNTALGIGGPLPPGSGGETYLNFLTNAVGGGSLPTGMLPAFTNAATYPIVDIADTGFTDNPGDFDFFPFGNVAEGFERYRVQYANYDLSCGTFSFSKSTDSNGFICIPKFFLFGGDFATVPHGTAIASIIAGYNTDPGARDPSGFQFGMGISPFGVVGSTRVFQPILDVIDQPSCAYNIFESFCNTQTPDLIQNEYLAGGRIANNSWSERFVSGANDGLYSGTAQSYDVGVRDALLTGRSGATNGTPLPFPENQELIVVFANGNWGSQGNVGGFADITVTPPGTAKNVISVGATENVRLDGSGCLFNVEQDDSFNISSYSSFGPTSDGRFKPELVAPGGPVYAVGSGFWTNYVLQATGAIAVELPPQNIYFPSPSPDYLCTVNDDTRGIQAFVSTNVYGTSYSAPAVSGSIQLLWWYFQNRLNMLQPSPAMAKAYLLNSARYLPITNSLFGVEDSLPSVAQGMGELDLRRMFDGVPRVLRDESSPRAIDPPLITTNPSPQQTYFTKSGQSYEVGGVIASNNLPFRVTLAWTDAPGSPGNGNELVNDLNLEVTIGGQTYFGNRFNGHNSVSTAGGGGAATPDNLNPVESVFLDPALVPAVVSGAVWQVVVRAANIANTAVYHVGTNGVPNQDFALVVYNTATNFPTVSDVPVSPSQLQLQFGSPVTNNLCSTAIQIAQFPYSFTNVLSTNVYSNVQPSPSVARGGIDEFFKIANPTPGTVFTIDTFGSRFDTVLSVWRAQVVPEAVFVRGECGFLSEVVADNDANGGLQSQVSFTADGSNDYFIVVEPHNNGGGGTMVLNAQATKPPITITPDTLAFSDQVVGTTSASQTVTYQNNSVATVRIDTATITGANASDFVRVSLDCEGDFLAPGTNCFVAIAFSPTAVGVRQANLVFTDDATGSPRVVPLSGNATPAAPIVCLSVNSGGAFNFGSQLLTTTSAVQSITITNCGSAALNISSVSLTGFGSNDFSVTQTCTGGPVAPGNTCTVNIAFNPQVAGARTATLVIADDAAGSPTTLSLTGVGVALAPSICFSQSPVSFASTVVGSTSSVQSVTITNCGTAPLVVSNLVLTSGNTGDFIAVASTPITVPTGNTFVVTLQFAPIAGGPRSASLAFVDNVPGGPTLLTLTGTASFSQPDAAIGKTTNVKKMLGNGIVNTTGAGQEFTQKIRRGAKTGLKFFVTLRNIGSSADRFTVQGDGNVPGFTVNYFLGASPKDSPDVSAAVESGIFSSSTLAPSATTGDSTMIRIEVFADKTLVQKGASNTFKLTFTSVTDPTKVDVVKATVTAK